MGDYSRKIVRPCQRICASLRRSALNLAIDLCEISFRADYTCDKQIEIPLRRRYNIRVLVASYV